MAGSPARNGANTAWAWGPNRITRGRPRWAFLCRGGVYGHTAADRSMSASRSRHASPGRIPVSQRSRSIAPIGPVRRDATASTSAAAAFSGGVGALIGANRYTDALAISFVIVVVLLGVESLEAGFKAFRRGVHARTTRPSDDGGD